LAELDKGKPFTMVLHHSEIPQLAMKLLGTPNLTMYVYGEITYLDAFKKEERHTKYRLMFGGSTPHFTTINKRGVRVANLRTAEDGNEAD